MIILLRLVLNIFLVWLLSLLMPEIFIVGGGISAYIVIGILISILNLLLRPILFVITLPLRLLTHIVAAIIVNMIFLWATEKVVTGVTPSIASLTIQGGFLGLLGAAAVFGLLNWALKSFAKKQRKQE